jgi:hypothetical protein
MKVLKERICLFILTSLFLEIYGLKKRRKFVDDVNKCRNSDITTRSRKTTAKNKGLTKKTRIFLFYAINAAMQGVFDLQTNAQITKQQLRMRILIL